MYAVFEDGSRQYRVSEGEELEVDFRDAEVGSLIEFDRVLLYQGGDDLKIGQPTLVGAKVVADVVEQTSIKTYIQHFRKRKNYRRLRGHRQPFTRVQIRSMRCPVKLRLDHLQRTPKPIPALTVGMAAKYNLKAAKRARRPNPCVHGWPGSLLALCSRPAGSRPCR